MLLLKYSVRNQSANKWRILKTLGFVCLLGITAPLLSACAFQPLYGPTASGGSLNDTMKSVDITPIPGRVGQKLRNELIFKTTGGGNALQPVYRLDITVRESVSAILVKTTGDAEGQIYVLETTFKLIRTKDNVVAFKGTTRSRAPFDKFDSIFANTRARIDAEARASRTVADSIKTRIATFLSRTV